MSLNRTDASLPLEGLLVVDFTHLVAGPFCTMMLADAGAEVVKIEPPWGDNSRHRGATRTDGEIRVSSYLAAGNRGKHSVALNLKDAFSKETLTRLLDMADVVVENFAPGVIARMGFDLDELRIRRPEVITASISLFGGKAQGGPYGNRAGLAIVAEAESGVAGLCRDGTGRPIPFGFPLGDMASGLATYSGIVTALLARGRTGLGRHLDISMVQTLTAFNGISIAGESISGGGDRPVPTSPYGYFAAKDGYVAIAVNVDHLWVKFSAAIGRPELAIDPRFSLHSNRDPRREEVAEIVEGWSSTRTCDEVVAILSPVGVPCGKLETPRGLLDTAEMHRIGMFRSVDDDMGGEIEVPENILGYGEGRKSIPSIGRDTASVVTRLLQYSADDVRRLEDAYEVAAHAPITSEKGS
jgi:crotonobetainyl-CoA:carnitine CoA-transferase CaiB-like acyl-CoA transferase